MNRENRFDNNLAGPGAHRNISATKVKEIFIQNVANDDTRPLKIGMDKTVKQLKKEIEKLFNLNYSLDEFKLKIKRCGIPFAKQISEENENRTLLENHFTNQCLVQFGRQKCC